MSLLTHGDLVNIAEKWLLKRCGFAFSELNTLSYETPDAIGFRQGGSILIECKTSRADFLSDKKKIFRANPYMGVGLFRFYMCPDGLIKPTELPEKWGLLYVKETGKVSKKVGPKGNVWSSDNNAWAFTDRNKQNETALMYSALRRLHLRGVMPMIYERLEGK